ncbi:hypothetical protein SK128_013895, partial [Halocaridina rubra]
FRDEYDMTFSLPNSSGSSGLRGHCMKAAELKSWTLLIKFILVSHAKKQIWGLTAAGIYNVVSFTAYGYRLGQSPAQWIVSLPTTAFGDVALQVVDTDYDNWALMWACKRSMFGHMEAAIIVSRTTSIDNRVLDNLSKIIKKAGGDTDDLSTIQHGKCISTKGGRKFTIEFDPSLDKADVNFQAFGNGGGGGGGGGDSGTGLSPCIVEDTEYVYYYDDCPDDAVDPIFTTYDEWVNGDSGTGVDSSKFEGRPCIYLDYNSDYVVGDPCPDEYLDYAFLPEEFYQDEDFAGQACYNFVNGEVQYYEECPTNAEAPIPVDFYGDTATTDYYYDYSYYDYYTGSGDYYTGDYDYYGNSVKGSDARFDGRGCIAEVDGYYYAYPDDCPDDTDFAMLPEDFYSSYDLSGGPCFNIVNGKAEYYDECPSNAAAPIPVEFYDSASRALKGDKRLPVGKKGGRKQRKGKKLMELKGKRMLNLIENSEKLQRLLERGNVDWRKLKSDITMSELKKMVNNDNMWARIRKAFRQRSKRRSFGKVKKAQGVELWQKIFTNKEIQKLLNEAGAVLRGPAADLRFGDLKGMIKNDAIWRQIRAILLGASKEKKQKGEKEGKKGKESKSRKKKGSRKKKRKKKGKKKDRSKQRKNQKLKNGNQEEKGNRKSILDILKDNKDVLNLLKSENIAVDNLPENVKLKDLKSMIKSPGTFKKIKDVVKQKQKRHRNDTKKVKPKRLKKKRKTTKEGNKNTKKKTEQGNNTNGKNNSMKDGNRKRMTRKRKGKPTRMRKKNRKKKKSPDNKTEDDKNMNEKRRERENKNHKTDDTSNKPKRKVRKDKDIHEEDVMDKDKTKKNNDGNTKKQEKKNIKVYNNDNKDKKSDKNDNKDKKSNTNENKDKKGDNDDNKKDKKSDKNDNVKDKKSDKNENKDKKGDNDDNKKDKKKDR